MSKKFHRLIHQSEVDAVWQLHGEGYSKYKIATLVGVSHDTIDDILAWGRKFGSVGFDPVARQQALDDAERMIKAGVQHRDAARRVGISYRDMMSCLNEKYRKARKAGDRTQHRSECRAGMFSEEWWDLNNVRFVNGMLRAYPELEDVYKEHEARRIRAANSRPANEAMV